MGIKARRKRLSDGGDAAIHDGTHSASGEDTQADMSGPQRKRYRGSDAGNDDVDPDDGEDWREQLYHWKGTLAHNHLANSMVWKGNWLTGWQLQAQVSGSGVEASWKNNTFEYACQSYSASVVSSF